MNTRTRPTGFPAVFLLWSVILLSSRGAQGAEAGGGLFGGAGGSLDLKSTDMSFSGDSLGKPGATLATNDFALLYDKFDFDGETKVLHATGSSAQPVKVTMKAQNFVATSDKLVYEAQTNHYLLTGHARIDQTDDKGTVAMVGDVIDVRQGSDGDMNVKIIMNTPGQRAMLSSHPGGSSGRARAGAPGPAAPAPQQVSTSAKSKSSKSRSAGRKGAEKPAAAPSTAAQRGKP
ncbi:MAG: hypothetical protein NTW86_26100 [Candidatus Sumerlaeota bacterium]|nr:hypothetical protein [Candidatus Sumerlaeota bacterium]